MKAWGSPIDRTVGRRLLPIFIGQNRIVPCQLMGLSMGPPADILVRCNSMFMRYFRLSRAMPKLASALLTTKDAY